MMVTAAVSGPRLQSASEAFGNIACKVGPGVGAGLTTVQPGSADTIPGSGVMEGMVFCVGMVDGAGEVSFAICVLALLQALSSRVSSKRNLNVFFTVICSTD